MSVRGLVSLLCIPALAALTGCAVGPDYERPATPEPRAWIDDGAASLSVSWPSLDWWKGFGSVELDGLMDEAARENFDLAGAAARMRQADAQVKIAGGALLPSLDAGASAGRSRIPATTPAQKRVNPTPTGSDLYRVSLAASYEIDFWGRNADMLASAEASAAASRFDRQTVALTVQSAVAETYFAVLAYRDRLAVARSDLANAEHVLEAIRARSEVGTAAGLDLAQQETEVAQRRAAIPPLTQGARQNTYALAILLGRAPEDFLLTVPATLANVTLPRVVAGLPSGLLERRPDVAYAEARLKAVNADLRASEAALLPGIDLTAEGGAETIALSSLLQPSSVLYSIGASISQPIFHGGELEGGVELQKARWDEMVASYRKTAIAAFQDVDSALAAVQESARQEEEERSAVETARRAFDIAGAQLSGGTVDITVVLNVQRSLFSAEDALLLARLSHLQALVGLFRALGGGWQANG